jgi:phage pi2 protein 07
MDLKVLSNEEYDRIIEKLDTIISWLNEKSKKSGDLLSERWLDSSEVVRALKISNRTLQNYRDRNMIPFSKIGNKVYFKASDIERFLDDHYIKVH